jgi:hypothetical protein
MSRRARWLGAARALPALALFAAVALAGAPAAYADDEPPFLQSSFNQDVTIGVSPAPGKAFPVFIDAHGVDRPTLAIDTVGLAGVATIETPDGCTKAGTTITCTRGVPSEGDATLVIVLHPAARAAAGASGTYTVTTGGANVASQETDGKVTLADGVDLVVTSISPSLKLKVGDAFAVPVELVNVGSKAANGVVITLAFDHGLIPDTYSNCDYAEIAHQHVAVCSIPLNVAPGTGLVLVDGFGATVAPDANAFQAADLFVQAATEGSALPRSVAPHARSGGKTLKAVPAARSRAAAPQDIDGTDNFGGAFVEVPGAHRDVAAVGATATGGVGDTVSVRIGAKNNGPAAADATRTGPSANALHWTFVPPPGSTVTAAPLACESIKPDGTSHRGEPGGDFYRCGGPNFVGAGETVLVSISLKITAATPDATGTVSLNDKTANPPVLKDDNAGDNTADVILNPTTPSGGTGGGGGGLPVTGTRTDLIVGGGVLLLVLGAGLTVLGRRRRAT